jgi:hypothetical protein
MKAIIGRRYRVNEMAHPWDGRCATLERVEGSTGWLMRDNELKAIPLKHLADKGVLQSIPERVPQPDHFIRLFEVLENIHI